MPGYQTLQHTVAIAGAADLRIQALSNRLQFSDPAGLAARLGISSASWPLFGMLWPSSVELATRMAAHVLQPGQRILEVGCGLALASLVAHRRGADVTPSDLHPLAARFLAVNLRLNTLPPLGYRHGNWGAAPAGHAAVQARGCGLRHASTVVRGRFDLIIGSDVLYDRDASHALAGFIQRHAAPAAQVWIVDPDRRNRPRFTQALQAQGSALHDQRLDHPAQGAQPLYRGRLLSYCRSG